MKFLRQSFPVIYYSKTPATYNSHAEKLIVSWATIRVLLRNLFHFFFSSRQGVPTPGELGNDADLCKGLNPLCTKYHAFLFR
jgi:hypothetical protein